MKKVIYKSTAIQFIILLAAVIVLSTLWPMRLWKKDVTLSVTPATGTCTEAVNEEHSVMQTSCFFAPLSDKCGVRWLLLCDNSE